MVQTAGVAKLIGFLLSRPEARTMGRRVVDRASAGGGGIGVGKQLNAPRMITVLLAVALTLIGLSVTIQPIGFINDLLADRSIEITREQGWMALTGSPLLLIAGSILKGL
jgi:hypothetical protein